MFTPFPQLPIPLREGEPWDGKIDFYGPTLFERIDELPLEQWAKMRRIQEAVVAHGHLLADFSLEPGAEFVMIRKQASPAYDDGLLPKADLKKVREHLGFDYYNRRVLIPTTSDWHPTPPNGLLPVCMRALAPWKGDPTQHRISAWGDDDSGVERDFVDYEEALALFNRIAKMSIISREDFWDMGFVSA